MDGDKKIGSGAIANVNEMLTRKFTNTSNLKMQKKKGVSEV